MSQCDAILQELRAGRKLTALDAFRLCGTLAFRSRISELRDRGNIIYTRTVKRDGRTVWEAELIIAQREAA